MDKLIGFRCHLCRKRDPPICPHMLAVNSDVSQLVEAQSNAVVECNDEVSNAVPPLSEVACSSSALIPAPSCSKIFFFQEDQLIVDTFSFFWRIGTALFFFLVCYFPQNVTHKT